MYSVCHSKDEHSSHVTEFLGNKIVKAKSIIFLLTCLDKLTILLDPDLDPLNCSHFFDVNEKTVN